MIPEILFFAANLFYCLGYLVRDMLWLRVLSMAGAVLTFPYFFLQPEVLVSAIAWQGCFLLINLVNMVLLLVERQPAALNTEQQHLKNLVFGSFSNRDTLRLLSIATWKDAEPGDTLLEVDQQLDELHLLYSGAVRVQRQGRVLVSRSAGTFVGEVHYITKQPTSAAVSAAGQVRYLSWRYDDLERLFNRRRPLGKAFESLLAIDVARKLSDQPMREAVAASLTTSVTT